MAADVTESLWPSSVCRHRPLPASQILAVLSPDPVTTQRASPDMAADVTE
jgi:hypothetical protein